MTKTGLRSLAASSLRFVSRAWSAIGVGALLLAAAFLAWRIPAEREELREFWARTPLDDGPHVYWVDSHHVKVLRVQGDRSRKDFRLSEAVYDAELPELLPQELRPLLAAGASAAQEPVSEAPFPRGRLAAFSDVHGQSRHFRELLIRAGITNSRGKWTFGAGHLVVVGDVFDKGASVTGALWFIRGLEREAWRRGGCVHYLLGNHDHLALTGASEAVHYKYRLISQYAGLRHEHLFSRDSELGRWIRARNSMLKIGDRLFVHAGLSPEYLALNLGLEDTNRLLRLSLDPDRLIAAGEEQRRVAGLLSGGQGPLWWRGYFDNTFPIGFIRRVTGNLAETSAGGQALERALARFGVRQVVVGHTYTRKVRKLYDGKLVALCLNWRGNDAPGSIEDGELIIWDRNGNESLVTLRD